jgi:hypothetical protein
MRRGTQRAHSKMLLRFRMAHLGFEHSLFDNGYSFFPSCAWPSALPPNPAAEAFF